MDIENIINAVKNGRVRITDHADEEAVDDCLTYEEIYYSVIYGEVIEDYPNDNPYPSCLVFAEISRVNQSIAFGHIIRKINGRY